MSNPINASTSLKNLNHILRLACSAVMLGRGWQLLFWDVGLGQWAGGVLAAEGLLMLQQVCGVFLLLGGVGCWWMGRRSPWAYLLPVYALMLFGLALLAWLGKNREWAMLWEHAAQFMAPVLWFALLHELWSERWLLRVCRFAVALTFTCHGLYALGVPYGQPENFLWMTQAILGVEPTTAANLLVMAGVLDILLSIGLFFPALARYALVYALIWGLLTALARVVAYYDAAEPLLSLHQWLCQVVFRLPHAVLPYFLLKAAGHAVLPARTQWLAKRKAFLKKA